jgi:hypothetical protein
VRWFGGRLLVAGVVAVVFGTVSTSVSQSASAEVVPDGGLVAPRGIVSRMPTGSFGFMTKGEQAAWFSATLAAADRYEFRVSHDAWSRCVNGALGNKPSTWGAIVSALAKKTVGWGVLAYGCADALYGNHPWW